MNTLSSGCVTNLAKAGLRESASAAPFSAEVFIPTLMPGKYSCSIIAQRIILPGWRSFESIDSATVESVKQVNCSTSTQRQWAAEASSGRRAAVAPRAGATSATEIDRAAPCAAERRPSARGTPAGGAARNQRAGEFERRTATGEGAGGGGARRPAFSCSPRGLTRGERAKVRGLAA